MLAMMNMDIERIVREKCAELGIEYDDSIPVVAKNGEVLSEDVTIEMKAMYEGLARKMDNAIIQEEGK